MFAVIKSSQESQERDMKNITTTDQTHHAPKISKADLRVGDWYITTRRPWCEPVEEANNSVKE